MEKDIQIKKLKKKIKIQKILIESLIHKLKCKNKKKNINNNLIITKNSFPINTDNNSNITDKTELIQEEKKESNLQEKKITENYNKNDIDLNQKSNTSKPDNEYKKDGFLDKEFKELFYFLPESHVSFKNNLNFDELKIFLKGANIPILKNSSYNFSKNVKLYTKTNYDGIHKYLIENLNVSILNSYLFAYLLSKESDFNQKLLIFHDIILFIDDFSKLIILYSAIFSKSVESNKTEVKEKQNILYQVIRMIIENQLMADKELYSNDKNFNSLEKIIKMYHFEPQYHDFDKMANNLISAKSNIEMFSLRILAHYMDWDWSYNQLIVTILYPKYLINRDPLLLYIIGIIVSNGLRTIGYDISVKNVYEFLEKEGGIGLYFVRQVKKVDLPHINDFDNELMKCIF